MLDCLEILLDILKILQTSGRNLPKAEYEMVVNEAIKGVDMLKAAYLREHTSLN